MSRTNFAAQGTQRALEFEKMIQDAAPLDPAAERRRLRAIWRREQTAEQYAAEMDRRAMQLKRRVLGVLLLAACAAAWWAIFEWLAAGSTFLR